MATPGRRVRPAGRPGRLRRRASTTVPATTRPAFRAAVGFERAGGGRAATRRRVRPPVDVIVTESEVIRCARDSSPRPPSVALRRRPWREVAFASLDFETTGLDYGDDTIVSFGVVPVTGGRVVVGGSVHQLVEPSMPPSTASRGSISSGRRISRVRRGCPRRASASPPHRGAGPAGLVRGRGASLPRRRSFGGRLGRWAAARDRRPRTRRSRSRAPARRRGRRPATRLTSTARRLWGCRWPSRIEALDDAMVDGAGSSWSSPAGSPRSRSRPSESSSPPPGPSPA